MVNKFSILNDLTKKLRFHLTYFSLNKREA